MCISNDYISGYTMDNKVSNDALSQTFRVLRRNDAWVPIILVKGFCLFHPFAVFWMEFKRTYANITQRNHEDFIKTKCRDKKTADDYTLFYNSYIIAEIRPQDHEVVLAFLKVKICILSCCFASSEATGFLRYTAFYRVWNPWLPLMIVLWLKTLKLKKMKFY